MIDSSSFNMLSALNKFVIEALSENQHDFESISEDHPVVASFQKLNIESGLAIHINKNHQLVGITLKSEQYFPASVHFNEGFEDVFSPILEENITPLKLARALLPFEEIKLSGILFDVPISVLFLQLI